MRYDWSRHPPRRHLLYHIWPVAENDRWRRNLDWLLQRVDLFNGRRIMGVVHDDQSESPQAVMDYVAGHGFEFEVQPNVGNRGSETPFPGESQTFLRMLRKLHQDEGVVFYAHAKGVGADKGTPEIMHWTESMYRLCLDHWATVRRQLERFAATAAFRTHHPLDWIDSVYTGAFFWFRLRDAIERDWQNLLPFYGGVEVWPTLLFEPQEVTSVLPDLRRYDVQLPALYTPSGWEAVTPILDRWLETAIREPNPVPEQMLGQGIDGSPPIQQRRAEVDFLVRRLLESNVESLLTLGVAQGGFEWHVARVFKERGRPLKIDAVDLEVRPEAASAFAIMREQFGCAARLLEGDSIAEALRAQCNEHYDAVFIDANHGYREVCLDFDFARTRSPRLIALHDVTDSNFHAQGGTCVSRFWASAKRTHQSEEVANGEWGGTGILLQAPRCSVQASPSDRRSSRRSSAIPRSRPSPAVSPQSPSSSDAAKWTKIRYCSYAELAEMIRRWEPTLPDDLVAVCGIPRSGLIPASMLAQRRGCRQIEFADLIAGRVLHTGEWSRRSQLLPSSARGCLLIVDDSCWTGHTMQRIRRELPRLPHGLRYEFAAPFVAAPFAKRLHHCEVLTSINHTFEWNFLRDVVAQNFLVDLDGVICQDWIGKPEWEPSWQPVYQQHLQSARLQLRPLFPLLAIVTNRLERYRPQTRRWLAENRITYRQLIMNPARNEGERAQRGFAQFKADQYRQFPEATLFVESDPEQARAIHRESGRPVFDFPAMQMLAGPASQHGE